MGISEKPDLVSGTSVGQYTVTRRIGAGGMGEVYEATHSGLGKRVAIKTLRRVHAENDIVVTRFLREGQLAARIRHPHIVDVTDVGMIDGLPCLVMEYLEGESLHALFKRESPLELSRLVDLLLPVIAAVDAAHGQGVVHRDLKPANIFLARGYNDVTPKVLDFGISKVVQEAAPSELTTDSTFLGSPHYVSPELARGDRDLDGRSDQYSLGVILYEGACGVRPFAHRAETFMALMYAIAQGDCQPPRVHRPGISPEFERIVMRAMARQRNDRFPSTGALGRALLPFASPRTRTIWEPVFGAAPTAKFQEETIPDRPRPTFEDTGGTLGQSAASISAGAPRGTRPLGMLWWALAGFAALIFGLGAALAVSKAVTYAKNRDATPVEEGDVEAVQPPPTTYSVSVSVTPAEATIEVDGKSQGTGSFSGTYKTEGRHTLRVSAPDHETQTVEFDAKSPPPAKIELRLQEGKTAPTATAKAPTRPGTAVRTPTVAPPKPSATATGGGGLKTDNRDPWEEK